MESTIQSWGWRIVIFLPEWSNPIARTNLTFSNNLKQVPPLSYRSTVLEMLLSSRFEYLFSRLNVRKKLPREKKWEPAQFSRLSERQRGSQRGRLIGRLTKPSQALLAVNSGETRSKVSPCKRSVFVFLFGVLQFRREDWLSRVVSRERDISEILIANDDSFPTSYRPRLVY